MTNNKRCAWRRLQLYSTRSEIINRNKKIFQKWYGGRCMKAQAPFYPSHFGRISSLRRPARQTLGRLARLLDVPKFLNEFGPRLARRVPSQLLFNWTPVCWKPTFQIILIY